MKHTLSENNFPQSYIYLVTLTKLELINVIEQIIKDFTEINYVTMLENID